MNKTLREFPYDFITANSPYEGRPPFFNSSALWTSPGGAEGEAARMAMYLDVDKDERILESCFELAGPNSFQERFRPYLHILCSQVAGAKLHQVLSWGTEIFRPLMSLEGELGKGRSPDDMPFFPLPLILLKQAVKKYLGVPPLKARLKGQREDDLLCRCFGVYAAEVKEFLQQRGPCDVKDVSMQLQAGSGCAQCVKDIRRLVLEKQYPPQVAKGQNSGGAGPSPVRGVDMRSRLAVGNLSLTPVQFTLKAAPFIEKWLRERGHSAIRVDLMRIQGTTLYFRVWPREQGEILSLLIEDLRIFFGERLLTAVLDDAIELLQP